MGALLNMNRRHKVGLLLTLVAAGASLLVRSGLQVALGMVLVGLAFTWAFGCNDRLVHGLLMIGGVLLIVGPMSKDWIRHQDEIARYRAVGEEEVSRSDSERQPGKVPSFEQWLRTQQRQLHYRPHRPPGPFSPWGSFTDNWKLTAPGLFFCSVGLILFVAIKPKPEPAAPAAYAYTTPATPPAPTLPYRWGKFLGWFFLIGTPFAALSWSVRAPGDVLYVLFVSALCLAMAYGLLRKKRYIILLSYAVVGGIILTLLTGLAEAIHEALTGSDFEKAGEIFGEALGRALVGLAVWIPTVGYLRKRQHELT